MKLSALICISLFITYQYDLGLPKNRNCNPSSLLLAQNAYYEMIDMGNKDTDKKTGTLQEYQVQCNVDLCNGSFTHNPQTGASIRGRQATSQ